MPDKYHIQTRATAGKFRRVGQFASIDWREDCARCTNCVKNHCVYDVYRHEAAANADPQAAMQTLYECKACFSCVQGCTKGLLSIGVNPEYLALGDQYWKPSIIATTWNQAETGRIPVSGAGYRGAFSGPGFDSIWTDMSEIVRPTRDGIHGREYISTMVEIGAKAMRLNFDADGNLQTPPAQLIEVQMPAILDVPPWPMSGATLSIARAAAARRLHSLAIIPAAHLDQIPAENLACVVPLVTAGNLATCSRLLPKVRMVELAGPGDMAALAREVAAANPTALIALRIELGPDSAKQVAELAAGPFKIFHLCADLHGCARTADGSPGPHLKNTLREIHGRLVLDGRRDEVTLIAAGGIALAEHMAKAIICGADLVAVDTPLLVALGCRVCRDGHTNGKSAVTACPAELETLDPAYAAERMVNLMGAWHAQLIEVLGAMGIREVRRLRGEVGRAMFLEDIEKEAFRDLVRK
jgi:hypothetical protein